MSKEKYDGSRTCIRTEYDKCMYKALINHMKAKTPSKKCTAPWVIDDGSGTQNICKEAKNINATFWEAWNRVTNQLQDCPEPCNSVLVQLGAKNYEVCPRFCK